VAAVVLVVGNGIDLFRDELQAEARRSRTTTDHRSVMPWSDAGLVFEVSRARIMAPISRAAASTDRQLWRRSVSDEPSTVAL
jgi:hypothetical protein